MVKICPNEFFLNRKIKYFHGLLLTDTCNQVKLAILRSFNILLRINNVNQDYKSFKKYFDKDEGELIFKDLLDEFSPHSIRIEAIKFICLMIDKEIIDEYGFIENHFLFYSKFTDSENKYAIIQRKLACSSQFLPYIIKSIKTLDDSYIEKFINFSIDFMNLVTKEKSKYVNQTTIILEKIPKTLFQLKFYEKIFCSYSKTLRKIIKIKPMLIESQIESIIKLCLSSLFYGVNENESLHILFLLEKCLHFIGLEKTIEINNQFLINGLNLYQIVYNTGSHFISPLINKFIIRVLGFVGAQPAKSIKTNKSTPVWKRNLNFKISELDKYDIRRKYFYAICSESLFKILDDELMHHLHFTALNSLIKIQRIISVGEDLIGNEFKRSFEIFNKLLTNSSVKRKEKFIPLLGEFVRFPFLITKKFIPDLVKSLIDLWCLGSSKILPVFISSLGKNLGPYLNNIIPLVLSLNDSTETVNLLVSLYNDVIIKLDNQEKLFFNIIILLVQMINEEKVEAFIGLNVIIPKLNNLNEYISIIVEACSENITHSEVLNQNCFDVLKTLLLNSKKSLEINQFFKVYEPSIIDCLSKFPNELNEYIRKEEDMENYPIPYNPNKENSDQKPNKLDKKK